MLLTTHWPRSSLLHHGGLFSFFPPPPFPCPFAHARFNKVLSWVVGRSQFGLTRCRGAIEGVNGDESSSFFVGHIL